MEATHQVEKAHQAAKRLLLTVNHVRRQLRCASLPHETPADLRASWAVQFKLLRKRIEAEKAVLTPEYLAGLAPTGCYAVDTEYAAPTAMAAALALACRLYRVLPDTLEAMGWMPPADLEEAYQDEPERGLCEWLERTPERAVRYWQAAGDAVGKLETGRELWPAIGKKWATITPGDGQGTETAGGKRSSKKGRATINARIIELLQTTPEAAGWSARKIATHLRCGKSAVASAPTFRVLEVEREKVRAEQATSQRRNRKRLHAKPLSGPDKTR
jgi:hypothetical protein